MTNELVQSNGSYNPDYIPYLLTNLCDAALKLGDILAVDEQDDRPGFLSVNLVEAVRKIVNVQWFINRIGEESERIAEALEELNDRRAFIESRNLKASFDDYMINKIKNLLKEK